MTNIRPHINVKWRAGIKAVSDALAEKLDKTGGIVSGDLSVDG